MEKLLGIGAVVPIMNSVANNSASGPMMSDLELSLKGVIILIICFFIGLLLIKHE